MAYPSLLACLADQVDKRPEKIAILQGGERKTYQDLWRVVVKVADFLREKNVSAGDRILLYAENSYLYVAAYYGIWACGGVAVALNTDLNHNQLQAIIAHTGAKVLFFKGDETDLQSFSNQLDVLDLESLDAESLNPKIRPELDISKYIPTQATNNLAAIIYTSGTTGKPKGVMLSEINLSANTKSIISYLELNEFDKVFCGLPFYYSYGNSVLHAHLSIGATLVLENSFAYPRKILEIMETESVTGFVGVPSTYALLLNRCSLSEFSLPRLRYLTQAGGAMAIEAIKNVRTYWPKASFFVMYGQTEATARLTYLPPYRLDDKLGSVGIPIPGVDIRILDNRGNELPANQQGEICASGANIMLGYWKDEENTQEKFYGRWLRTGDLGFIDDDGYINIVGRNSDMIKSGAHRIAPEEVEQVISELEEIQEVAVVGIPDSLMGQVIKAFVVINEGCTLDKKKLMRHCKNYLPQYKWPKELIFVDELPRTSSGKVKRYHLLTF